MSHNGMAYIKKSIDFYLDFSVNRCHGYILVCQHVGFVRKICNVIVVLCSKLFTFHSSGVGSCFSSLESHSSRHSAIYSVNYYSDVYSSSRYIRFHPELFILPHP